MSDTFFYTSPVTTTYGFPVNAPEFTTFERDQYGIWSQSSANFSRYETKFAAHIELLSRSTSNAGLFQPVFVMNIVTSPGIATASNSDQAIGQIADNYYNVIDIQLTELEGLSTLPSPPVDRGAIITAKEIVRQLRDLHIVPPGITWHGGDAIVMIWAFSSITWAITVTDGEVGYVIRRDRKQEKFKDSIKIREFKLLEMK